MNRFPDDARALLPPSCGVGGAVSLRIVSDGAGRLVKGLGPSDFRIFEDEVPQAVTHFIPAEAERELVVAVDMSGSMTDAMPACREAVRRFLATLRPVDHATLPSRADFYFLGGGIAAVRSALRLAGRLRRVVRDNLALAAAYNLAALALCFAGVVTPVWAAVLMPISSAGVVSLTALRLSERRLRCT